MRVALALAVSLAGVAALATDVEAITARVANFRELGTAFKHVTDELKRRNPDLGRIRQSARLIKERGGHMLDWFPPGSEPPPPVDIGWWDRIRSWFDDDDELALPEDAKSNARIEVWTERAAFARGHQAFVLQADKLWQAAQGSDTAAIALQARALGKSCESCHDKFRYEID